MIVKGRMHITGHNTHSQLKELKYEFDILKRNFEELQDIIYKKLPGDSY